ncbi:ABC transporter [Tothia fuscella]|uniref:ABC transporter n=1 Tax=Tothia fuscella TaxID=1048955 RepID=A0A9P4NM82_9PEZI|nr:ABC transporter [Tothia fuscella]
MSPACELVRDQAFGPAVQCADQFDFTLYFEQAIMDVGFSGLFLLVVPFRIYYLWGSSIKCSTSPIYSIKIAASLLSLGVELACFVLWVMNPLTHASIAAGVLEFVTSLVVVGLVSYEYTRTSRPSTITSLYLLSSAATRAVQVRTLSMRDYVSALTGLIASSLATKLFLLLWEAWPKNKYLLPLEDPFGPEEVSGVFNRTFFWWLNPLFLRGNKHILAYSDLYPLDHSFHASSLQKRMHKAWAKFEHKGPMGFLYAYFYCFRWELLQTIFPRSCVIALGYAQTFLITATIAYLQQRDSERDVRHAYGLIAAAAVIYGGLAFANVKFTQKVFRIITSFRGATCSLIFAKSLLKKAGHSDLAAVTLMSTDVDRMTMGLQLLVEVWAQLLSVGIGVWLLWRQLGPVAVAPILVTLLCFFVQSYISKFMGFRQARWVAAIQRRIGIASSTLRSMKAIKLSGLVDSLADLLQSERVRELKLARHYRILNVWVQVVIQTPTIFSALVVFAAYAIEVKIKGSPPLTTSQAFTSLAIISLLTTPAAILLATIPMVAAAYGCVKRIEKFLNSPDFDDQRIMSRPKSSHPFSFDKHNGDIDDASSIDSDGVALSTTNLMFGPSTEKTEKVEKSTGDPITFEAKIGTLSTVLGPVGCGKSTFLRTILNEIKPTSGSVSITSPFVGYCAQTPWLPNGKVRDIIVGPNKFDEAFYRSVLETCALEEDFRNMPEDDLTLIGSRGIVLSGGQKHRLSLARALYSRCTVLVLDDFLSSLDSKTQDFIAERLLARDGYIRRHGCTVLLATHITKYVQLSDNLLVMGPGGTVEYCGPPDKWPSKRVTTEDETKKESEDKATDLIKVQSVRKMEYRKDKAQVEVRSEDVKRQTGDFGVWVYYSKSMGWMPIVLALVFMITSVFCINFPSKLLHFLPDISPAF